MSINQQTRRDRALELKGFIARHDLTLKEVAREARVKYVSTTNAMGLLIKKHQELAISDERLALLESAAKKLAKASPISAS